MYNATRITIGDQVFEGLRTEFQITRATALYSRATLQVYNMSLESFNALKYDAISILEVLSTSGWQKIFTGNFRLQQRRNSEGSTISTLDFFESVLLYKDKYNLSMDAGSTGNDVIKYFKDAMPMIDFVISDKAQSLIDELVFPGGYSPPVGDYYTLLTDFIFDHLGIENEPYFDNSKIVIGETNKAPIKINVNTGMIDSPEFVKRIEKQSGESEFSGSVYCRLLPTVSIYDKIYIESQYLKVTNDNIFAVGSGVTEQQYQSIKQPGNGLYISKKITHNGDTHTKTWQTKIDFVGADLDRT
uniref:Uncharacterized protein n=5 Tax=Vibrionaceae TaxID=641 RepID=A0A0H4A4I6_9VIBR|nr:hypothetical protein [Vibrio splendidus]AKN38741.1 hypothetical protein [Enterovibrio norvegicus]AKN38959.1 hypothetical protein [Aliivibrio fischeri]AKN39130.1 hypothetical protein [Vibrio kanaloae]AKN40073.1 hypothetical protein [Vibrio tasmaniensis]